MCRMADKHGNGILTVSNPPADIGIRVYFLQKRHGQLVPAYLPGSHMHTAATHQYDVGYYGALLKRGTYPRVFAGDPNRHLTCKPVRKNVKAKKKQLVLNFSCPVS